MPKEIEEVNCTNMTREELLAELGPPSFILRPDQLTATQSAILAAIDSEAETKHIHH